MGDSRTNVVKVILLGDGGVGKSSLMNRFVSNTFDAQSFHTIGVEFLNRDVALDTGEQYTLQIWDTAGQERFKSLRTPFYRGADCCLLTFALDDKQSLFNISMWRKEFFTYADVTEEDTFPFVLLGNKCDIAEKQVTHDDAMEWCSKNGDVPYFEVSAKECTNVDAAFLAAVKRIKELDEIAERNNRTVSQTVDLRNKGRRERSKPCC